MWMTHLMQKFYHGKFVSVLTAKSLAIMPAKDR